MKFSEMFGEVPQVATSSQISAAVLNIFNPQYSLALKSSTNPISITTVFGTPNFHHVTFWNITPHHDMITLSGSNREFYFLQRVLTYQIVQENSQSTWMSFPN